MGTTEINLNKLTFCCSNLKVTKEIYFVLCFTPQEIFRRQIYLHELAKSIE